MKLEAIKEKLTDKLGYTRVKGADIIEFEDRDGDNTVLTVELNDSQMGIDAIEELRHLSDPKEVDNFIVSVNYRGNLKISLFRHDN